MNYAMAGFLCTMFAVPFVIWTRHRNLKTAPKETPAEMNEEEANDAETKM